MKNLGKVVSSVVLLSLMSGQSCLALWPFSKKKDAEKKELVKKADSKGIAKDQKDPDKVVASDNQSPEIAQLLQDSELAISRLESNLAKKEQKLKVATDAKLAEIAQALKANLSAESLKIRQEATSQTLGIINKAEEEALALRQRNRLQSFSERFGIPLTPKTVAKVEQLKAEKPKVEKALSVQQPEAMLSSAQMITAELRNTLSRQFYEDMLFMKEIIVGAEHPSEIKDFEKRFVTQNKWFERTLKKAAFTYDGHYVQLQEKQKKVHDVVMAQKQADKLLFKMAHGLEFSSGQLDRARLMVLYDLNDVLKNKEEDAETDERVVLSRNDIDGVVTRVFAEISTKYKEREGDFPDVKLLNSKTTPVIPVMAQQLHSQLMFVQGKLARAERLLAERKDFHDTVMVRKLEQTSKHAIGLEIELRKAGEASTFLQQKALGSSRLLFAKKLEEKERKCLDLDVLLRRVSQQADYFKQRVSDLAGRTSLLEAQVDFANRKVVEAQDSAQQQFALRKEVETKRSLDQQIAQQTIASINRYSKAQRLELQEVTNKLRLTEGILRKAQQDNAGQAQMVQQERSALLARQNALTQEQGQLSQLRIETQRLVENSMRVNDGALIGMKKAHESEMHKMQAELKQELDFVRQELGRMQSVKQVVAVPAALPAHVAMAMQSEAVPSAEAVAAEEEESESEE